MEVGEVAARRILNSAGNPAIEAAIRTSKGKFTSSVPSGTSAGKHEFQFDLEKSIDKLNKLKVQEITSIQELIAFEKKIESPGFNTLPLMFSLLKGLAAEDSKQVWQFFETKQRMKRPLLLNKVIGGGLHAKAGPEFQEFLIQVNSDSFAEILKSVYDIHRRIGKRLNASQKDLEGGWIAGVTNEQALEIIKKETDRFESETGVKTEIGLDIAASSFYRNQNYDYKERKLSKQKQMDYVEGLAEKFSIKYIEDPLHEDDFDGFAELKKRCRCLICGDDLLTTNPERLMLAVKKNSVNSAIIKPNQIGYIYKLLKFIELCKKNKYAMVISHRSQETMDNILSDLCIGFGCQKMKIGVFGAERTAKIKRLLEIFDEKYDFKNE